MSIFNRKAKRIKELEKEKIFADLITIDSIHEMIIELTREEFVPLSNQQRNELKQVIDITIKHSTQFEDDFDFRTFVQNFKLNMNLYKQNKLILK